MNQTDKATLYYEKAAQGIRTQE